MKSTTAEWLSTKQLCVYIGISQRTFDRMQSKGKAPLHLRKTIPGTSTYRYRKSDIDSWLESEGNEDDLSNAEAR